MARQALFTCYFALMATICGLVLSGCTNGTSASDSLYDYYINEQTFAGKGMVYTYAPVNNPELPREYWHYRFIHHWRGNTFKSVLYDAFGDVSQESTERLDSNQANLMSLELLFRTEEGQQSITPRINARGTFPFGQVNPGVGANYQIEYQDTSSDTVRVILTKDRVLQQRTEYAFRGVTYPALQFVVTETLETETQGFTESTWSGVEIYAQDLGLVYFRKEITDELVLEYALQETMTFDTFRAGD